MNKRFGAVGTRRGRLYTAGSAAVVASDPWDQIKDSAVTNSPLFMWYFDTDWLTLAGSDIAQVEDAWKLGAATHNLTAAANRPSWDGTYGVWTAASSETMVADFATPEAAGEFTWSIMYKPTNYQHRVFNCSTVGTYYWGTDANSYYYNGAGAKLDTGVALDSAWQHLVIEFANGTGTASMRKNGVQMGAKGDYPNTAITGTCRVGSKHDGAANFLDGQVLWICCFSGVDATDTASLETVGATLKP